MSRHLLRNVFFPQWGTAIPAAIFNNRFDQIAPDRINDQPIVRQLIGGQAYEHATAVFLRALPPETREQFKEVLTDSLKRTWYVAIAFSALGFLLVILEKEIPLRQELETEYGMVEKEKIDRGKVAEEGADKEKENENENEKLDSSKVSSEEGVPPPPSSSGVEKVTRTKP